MNRTPTISTPGGNPWLLRPQPRPRAAVRLFCLAHAGGSAWMYRGWPALVPEGVEVCAVQLPGHGNRVGEPGIAEFAPLLAQLAKAIEPELDRPFALFGHSLGALLAFELARWSVETLEQAPVQLFVSGHNAPHLPETEDGLTGLDDAAVIERLRALGCTPAAVLENGELMELMLPAIRADFAVCESYAHRAGPPLPCPLSALAGTDDPRTDRAGVEAWRRHTSGPFAVRWFPGDHFFVALQERILVQMIAAELAGARGGFAGL
jgi:medium-chain acyl-[acyl-carrier-protein] hydrolase